MDRPLLARIPGIHNIFVGSLYALNRKSDIEHAKITHVLSVFRPPIDQSLFEGYTHKLIPVDDVTDENILEHIPQAIEFIHNGLATGGGVLIHCVMGRSRSATIATAFLMRENNLPATEALEIIKSVRPFVQPNDGFLEQLDLYHRLGCPATTAELENSPGYQRWLYKREVETSTACGQAPDSDKIRFEDEAVGEQHHQQQEQQEQQQQQQKRLELKCRKCRRALATDAYIIPHDRKAGSRETCAHYFIDALSWMRNELEKGLIEGRLECPNTRCGTNVGKYAWQGMRCNCGEWVVPGISLAKSRIDEQHKLGGGGIGLRVPPGKGNL